MSIWEEPYDDRLGQLNIKDVLIKRIHFLEKEIEQMKSQQQVSVEPEVSVKLAKTDIETLDIEARKFLLDNKCDDLVLNNRPFYKGNYLYASNIMVKFISKFSE